MLNTEAGVRSVSSYAPFQSDFAVFIRALVCLVEYEEHLLKCTQMMDNKGKIQAVLLWEGFYFVRFISEGSSGITEQRLRFTRHFVILLQP